MGSRVNYGGFVVAGVGFFLTRFTVTLALYDDPVRFYLAGVVPLVLGLGLAAFGVALAVADVESTLAWTTARWCCVGAASMAVLVLLTLVGSTAGGLPDLATVRSRAYLSNFLVGGSVGGTLTGLYAARNRRQRERLRQGTNRLEVLNRMLRHEVLNALTAIRGYAALADEGDSQARAVIEDRAASIGRTIEEVKYLTGSVGADGPPAEAVELGPQLRESVAAVRREHPEADVTVDSVPDGLAVRADDHLGTVFRHLLENAVVHGAGVDASEAGVDADDAGVDADDAPVEVSVSATPGSVRVRVRDRGPGLPESQRALLEAGEIEEFDDPETGFGLNVVRLLVERYHGAVETDVDASGTTVTVVLQRPDVDDPGLRPDPAGLAGVRPSAPHLAVTLGAAIVAGIVYGLVAESLGGSIGFIGVYYGVQDPVVGWITHEFHSVVFAFAFAGIVSLAPDRYRNRVPGHAAIGIGWGVVLWLLAAGVVSPVWLRLVGVPASIPTLSEMLFWSHLGWGATLGVLTAVGYEFVSR